jgi:hypothetical protein
MDQSPLQYHKAMTLVKVTRVARIPCQQGWVPRSSTFKGQNPSRCHGSNSGHGSESTTVSCRHDQGHDLGEGHQSGQGLGPRSSTFKGQIPSRRHGQVQGHKVIRVFRVHNDKVVSTFQTRVRVDQNQVQSPWAWQHAAAGEISGSQGVSTRCNQHCHRVFKNKLSNATRRGQTEYSSLESLAG